MMSEGKLTTIKQGSDRTQCGSVYSPLRHGEHGENSVKTIFESRDRKGQNSGSRTSVKRGTNVWQCPTVPQQMPRWFCLAGRCFVPTHRAAPAPFPRGQPSSRRQRSLLRSRRDNTVRRRPKPPSDCTGGPKTRQVIGRAAYRSHIPVSGSRTGQGSSLANFSKSASAVSPSSRMPVAGSPGKSFASRVIDSRARLRTC